MLIEIWCEGDPRYDFTACHLGYGKGESLKEACEELATKRDSFKKWYKPSNMTYMGCKLFFDEKDARENYG